MTAQSTLTVNNLFVNGTWETYALYKGLGKNLGWFTLPPVPGGKDNGAQQLIELPNNAISISANSPHKAEAVKFIEYMETKGVQLTEAKAGNSIASKYPLPASVADPVTLGPIEFSLHWMLLGISLAISGLQCVYMGILSQVFFDYSGAAREKWFRRFSYTRAVVLSALLFSLGLTIVLRKVHKVVACMICCHSHHRRSQFEWKTQKIGSNAATEGFCMVVPMES